MSHLHVMLRRKQIQRERERDEAELQRQREEADLKLREAELAVQNDNPTVLRSIMADVMIQDPSSQV